MNISKQRLIEIIKEELQEDMAGNPMFPVKDVERGAQLQQADDMDALKNETSSEQILDTIIQGKDALSEIKGLFNRIQRQDQWDWFTVFEQFGCPGRIKSKNIAYNISELRICELRSFQLVN